MNIGEAVAEVEAKGTRFRLDGEKVRVWYPDEKRREELAAQVKFLRERRAQVAAFLRMRGIVPPMSPGVRLVAWNLKEPPIAIETCTVVTDPARFASTTLAQLKAALANPGRWDGWSVPQLIDRLAQVGVSVVIESSDKLS